jgi:dephospho-CoA kinase
VAAAGAKPAPRILGLTGPIGCGKSTVGDILLQLGVTERIDADQVVHELMAAGTETTRSIATAFGDDVLRDDGSVDRIRLGRVVFSDGDALRRLESITHPAVRRLIRERLHHYSEREVVVIDAIKLLQSDLLPLVEAVWVVRCARDAQIARLTEIRRMPREQAESRIAAMPRFESERVTEVIENSRSMDELRSRVEAAYQRFLSQPRGTPGA